METLRVSHTRGSRSGDQRGPGLTRWWQACYCPPFNLRRPRSYAGSRLLRAPPLDPREGLPSVVVSGAFGGSSDGVGGVAGAGAVAPTILRVSGLGPKPGGASPPLCRFVVASSSLRRRFVAAELRFRFVLALPRVAVASSLPLRSSRRLSLPALSPPNVERRLVVVVGVAHLMLLGSSPGRFYFFGGDDTPQAWQKL